MTRKRNRAFTFLIFLSILLLTACAAGKDGTGVGAGPGRSVTPRQEGNVPDPAGSRIRGEFLDAVNKARSVPRRCGKTRYGPAPPVSWSGSLATAARLHSRDMVAGNFFSHTGSDGSSAGQRILRQGYSWRACGENIAVGVPAVPSVVQGWLESEEHCRNLMDPAFTEIGAGVAVGPYGGNPVARFWTLDLATVMERSRRKIR